MALVAEDGSRTTVLAAADGLSNPTAIAVRGERVYVTDSAFVTGVDPNLLTARFDRRSQGGSNLGAPGSLDGA
ncbi:hypothetical protein ABT095_28370 [Kitasatospora sp. NPDC002227]|uniref:hypothetical protein n=1 Tax=Kitasatospora sp. NPDC002227 TaxID=3154773 RepID=UPI003327BB05